MLAGQFTVLVDVAERDLTGYAQPYDALRLEPVEEITAVVGRGGDPAAGAPRADGTQRGDTREQRPPTRTSFLLRRSRHSRHS